MKSKLHKQTLDALKQVFPGANIKEEYRIRNPTNKQSLYVDIYIPIYKLAIEVQGSQHDEYNNFFYSDRTDFARQQENDTNKAIYCLENDITLIYVNHDEDITPELIQSKIEEAVSEEEEE